MKSFFSLFLLLCFLSAFGQEKDVFTGWTNLADDFLRKYVENGLMDYEAISQKPIELKFLTSQAAKMDLTNLNHEQKKAFWINAYNLFTIQGIVEKWPVESPLKINGFFETIKHTVAGEKLTLNDIEHQKLMPVYRDARLHFVLVCAAIGCPKLASFAYRAEELENQLEQQTKLALNDPLFVRLNESGKKVELSELFVWYAKDFQNTGLSLIEYLNKYRDTLVPSDFSVGYYKYDWTLNKKKAR